MQEGRGVELPLTMTEDESKVEFRAECEHGLDRVGFHAEATADDIRAETKDKLSPGLRKIDGDDRPGVRSPERSDDGVADGNATASLPAAVWTRTRRLDVSPG